MQSLLSLLFVACALLGSLPFESASHAILTYVDELNSTRVLWGWPARNLAPLSSALYAAVEEPSSNAIRRDEPNSGTAGSGPWFRTVALSLRAAVLWLWDLGGDLKSLERVTVVCLAVLLAFLTVAGLWKIAPPTELTTLREIPAANAARPPAAQTGEAENPLKSNLGRTVLSGLGGLVAVTFLEQFWEKAGVTAKAYYVVWFVISFVALLAFFAFVRGLVEAYRIRLASEHRPAEWRARGEHEWGLTHRLRYWVRRSWLWMLSFRPPILVFLDTSLSVLFGENVLRNAVLSDTIAKLQLSLILVVDRVRNSVGISVRHALIRAGVNSADLEDSSVRVNVSVLSPDGAATYYISWAPGSLERNFDRQSVAWIAISAGEARWWTKQYEEDDRASRIVIYDNSRRRLSAREGRLTLKEFFQARGSHDYEAFIVLPAPRRATDGDYWKAGIHISFSKAEYFRELWGALELQGEADETYFDQFYRNASHVLDKEILKNEELRAVLYESTDVIAEVLRRFNAVVYDTYVRPRLLR